MSPGLPEGEQNLSELWGSVVFPANYNADAVGDLREEEQGSCP